jgi:hypothetical protein
MKEIKKEEEGEKENQRVSTLQDMEEEINLFEKSTNEQREGFQKYFQSKEEFNEKVKGQHDFIHLFKRDQQNPKGNVEFKDSMKIVKNEDFPSKEDIERDRGDKNEYLSSDPFLQQAQSYMIKFKVPSSLSKFFFRNIFKN